MTNLKTLSDQALLANSKTLVTKEREILTDILHHLREIERRRLYSDLKMGSLYELAMKYLGYTEDQACRRIGAMRLLKEIPEIEEKISDGSLSLTHLNLAQCLFRKEKKVNNKIYSKTDKIEILEKFEKTSKREAEKIALAISPTSFRPTEKVKILSQNDVELRLVVKEESLKKAERLKNLLAHQNPNMSLSELFDKLCDLGLREWDKTISAPARVTGRQNQAQVRRNIWKKSQGQCQICTSTYALEIDHIIPKALGGPDTEENLRLLCRSCNQREAIKVYGQQKMDLYVN